MPARPKSRLVSLDARAAALAKRKARLEYEIDGEMGRPLPCHLQLGRLKRSRLRLKDEMASLEGVLTTVQRARMERRIG